MDGDKPELERNLSESNHETTESLFWRKKGVKGAEKVVNFKKQTSTSLGNR